jgi:hypothetical protein
MSLTIDNLSGSLLSVNNQLHEVQDVRIQFQTEYRYKYHITKLTVATIKCIMASRTGQYTSHIVEPQCVGLQYGLGGYENFQLVLSDSLIITAPLTSLKAQSVPSYMIADKLELFIGVEQAGLASIKDVLDDENCRGFDQLHKYYPDDFKLWWPKMEYRSLSRVTVQLLEEHYSEHYELWLPYKTWHEKD